MRAALLILLGFAIGVIGTAQVMSALAARNPMPKAVMHTMGYHMGALKHAMKAKQCDAATTLPHLLRLQSTATDILPTFGIADHGFSDDEHKLQLSLQQAITSAPANCAALATALKPVGASCQDCHQQYR